MQPEIILYIILGIVAFDFLFSNILDYINLKSEKHKVPDEMKEYYDEEKYAKAIDYHRTHTRFSFLTSTIGFVASFAMLALGGFGYVDSLLRPYFDNPIVLSLAFFGVLSLASDILTLPFQLYGTFVIEERFGFNKTTAKTFILDKIKGYILAAILGGLLISVLLYLIGMLGADFWLYFWGVAIAFMLLANMFFTSWVLPLFNKLTPLEDGELKEAIENYSRKVKFPLDNIFVIDGSKRSNKSNAFFSGIGKKKKIVLYDTLIKNHSTEELVAVLAHEVGHFKKKHVIYGFGISMLQIGLTLFIMSLMILNQNVSIALGSTVSAGEASQAVIHLNLLAFGILYSPISRIMSIFGNVFSRKNEFEADAYAAQTYKGEALLKALKKLSVDNLSNLFPHKAYVFFHYSHPPLLERLKAIKARG
ncbi:MAG: M48 family metallopeptidase [Bacteroidota bacterium]